MKLPAVEPFDQCQNCKAEMREVVSRFNLLLSTASRLFWCPKCGTLGSDKDQWVPSGKWISVEERLNDSAAWQASAREVMCKLLDAHQKLDRDGLASALQGIRILVGKRHEEPK